MNSSIVNKQIREHIRPVLKEKGFIKFTSRNAWRKRERVIEVINFQSFNEYLADALSCTTYSFSINLGVYYLSVHNNPWISDAPPEFPKEYECQARRVLIKTINQPQSPRPDIWYVDDKGLELPKVINDAKKVIEDEALPWLDNMSDLTYALKAFQSKPETFIKKSIAVELLGGNPPSMARLDVVSGIALELGKVETAVSYFSKVMSNPFYSRQSDTIKILNEQLSMIEQNENNM